MSTKGEQKEKRRTWERKEEGLTTGVVGAWVLVKMSIAVSRCQEIVSSTVDEGVGEVHGKSMLVGVEGRSSTVDVGFVCSRRKLIRF